MTQGAQPSIRADKWLWYARFFKTRTLASKVCAAGKLRIAGSATVKAHQKVKAGDVLTFPQGRHIRVVKVLALGVRRGPASEAQGLYEDLKPPTARRGDRHAGLKLYIACQHKLNLQVR